jgi:hypothetical protein
MIRQVIDTLPDFGQSDAVIVVVLLKRFDIIGLRIVPEPDTASHEYDSDNEYYNFRPGEKILEFSI